MKRYEVVFLRALTEHERAHGVFGPVSEVEYVLAKTKTAGLRWQRSIAKERGWRSMDIREVEVVQPT